MYPIAVVLALGLAIAFERWLFLVISKRSNRKAFEAMLPAMKNGNFDGLIRYADSSKAPVSRIVASAASAIKYDSNATRDDISFAMEESVMEAIPRLEKRTSYLATLANIATLLGLLGTIIGLIAAFTAVASAEPSEKATVLSSAISVAMNTTAFGLIAAIPLLIFHALLVTRTSEIIESIEMAGVKFLNIIARNK